MFIYNKMLEAAHFFNENSKRNTHLQVQLAEQTNAKLKEDLLEAKEEKRKETETLSTKLRQAE